MTFTDEDLKRFKGLVQKSYPLSSEVNYLWYKLGHLIARLEAAEKCIPYHECQDDLFMCPHLEAWRKAAGK